MKKCLAPSEIPGITSNDSSIFGRLAEDLIWADMCKKRAYGPNEVYVDDHNPSGYLYFLKRHNPSLNLTQFASQLAITRLGRKQPDILIHTSTEQIFYEIKPDSASGKNDGVEKLGILSATYKYFKLPYTLGLSYTPSEIVLASFANQLTVTLHASLAGPGLILYRFCLECNAEIELLTLAIIAGYIIKKLNKLGRKKVFGLVDLRPLFASEGQLAVLARELRMVMSTGTASVGWKYFWKAVAKRFAVRGAAAAALAAADGPLPIGDIIAIGIGLWTIVDIIRLSSLLWQEAAVLAKEA